MADEPLSNERLAEIREHAETVRGWLQIPDAPAIVDVRHPEPTPAVPMVALLLGADVLALLAEVERLRVREAAAMAIINDLIQMAREPFVCAGCGAEWPLGQNHTPDCAITRGYAWIDA